MPWITVPNGNRWFISQELLDDDAYAEADPWGWRKQNKLIQDDLEDNTPIDKEKVKEWYSKVLSLPTHFEYKSMTYPHLHKEKPMTKKKRVRRITEGKAKAAAARAMKAQVPLLGNYGESALKTDNIVPTPRLSSDVPAHPYVIRSTHEELYSDGRSSVEVTTYPNRVRS